MQAVREICPMFSIVFILDSYLEKNHFGYFLLYGTVCCEPSYTNNLTCFSNSYYSRDIMSDGQRCNKDGH